MKKKYVKRYLLSVVILCITIFVTYNVLTIDKTYYKNEKDINIPIFIYHDIVEKETEVKYDYMQTTTKRFKHQMKGLKFLGYHFITYKDLEEYNSGKKPLTKKSCIITFDDGWDGLYKRAYPILKENDIKATSCLVSYLVGKDGYYTWEQVKEMKNSGIIEFISHSMKHDRFDEKTVQDALNDVNESYHEIQEKLGNTDVKVFTYPYGMYTEDQIDALGREGYIQNLTDNRINSSSTLDMNRLHRCYPLNDCIPEIILKIVYREIRYK